MQNKEKIMEALNLVPKKPGSYQMYDINNTIIYVGKAKNLYNRLKSYFTGSHDAKTSRMVQDVDHFEYIVTSSEIEALLLELNLIKENRPKYNIMLMDDKTYPYIVVTNEQHPRIIMTRDIKKLPKNVKIFGPYPNAKACRDIVEMLNKIYPFRKCRIIPKKSCLYYDMGQCLAPCIRIVTDAENNDLRASVMKFLNGSNNDIITTLKTKMQKAADELEFEKAMEYRDMLQSIENIHEDQKITLNDGINRDIFGYAVKDGIINIQVFHMRNGNIIMRSGKVFDLIDSKEEMLISYISQFYQNLEVILPREIIIPYLEDISVLEELLKTKIVIPIKGVKKQLVDLVSENAKMNLDNLQKQRLIQISKTKEPLMELAEMLKINYPNRIEIFDNSNIQGMNAVSGMVVYLDGVKAPKEYRKYKIKTVDGADDYHTMIEVIFRRYSRLAKENQKMPDLIIVDGGVPQIKAAMIALNNAKVAIPIIGLAKDERHRTRAIVTSDLKEVHLEKRSNLFLLLESMQDEVHRFAITFFQKTHTKNAFESALDNIEGIGKTRKKLLLLNFDSIDEIKNAKIEKLKSLGFPEKVAQELLDKLKSSDIENPA